MTLLLSILKFLLRWKCHSSIFIDTSWDFFLSNNNISCWRLRDNKCVEWNAGYNIYRCRWPIWIWKPSGCLKIRPSRCSRSRQISTTRPANRSSPVSYYPNWNIPTSRKVRYPSVFLLPNYWDSVAITRHSLPFYFISSFSFFFFVVKNRFFLFCCSNAANATSRFLIFWRIYWIPSLKKKISIGIRCSLDK